MSIQIDACATRELIVVSTRSSVYELIVVRGEYGHVLVRGGTDFPEFRRAIFVGSTADGTSLLQRILAIGFRMQFLRGDRLVTTSAVRSLSRNPGHCYFDSVENL